MRELRELSRFPEGRLGRCTATACEGQYVLVVPTTRLGYWTLHLQAPLDTYQWGESNFDSENLVSDGETLLRLLRRWGVQFVPADDDVALEAKYIGARAGFLDSADLPAPRGSLDESSLCLDLDDLMTLVDARGLLTPRRALTALHDRRLFRSCTSLGANLGELRLSESSTYTSVSSVTTGTTVTVQAVGEVWCEVKVQGAGVEVRAELSLEVGVCEFLQLVETLLAGEFEVKRVPRMFGRQTIVTHGESPMMLRVRRTW